MISYILPFWTSPVWKKIDTRIKGTSYTSEKVPTANQMKVYLVYSHQVTNTNLVLTNIRRVGMLSDCTKGFLYSQISSGWITRWNGSKNSVKLKITI